MTGAGYISKLRNNWFTTVNNSPLIVFRMLFGSIMLMEFGKSLTSGWVSSLYIRSQFTFNFIGFDFLQHLHGPIMYYYFGLGCLASIMVILGLLYRFSSVLLAILWSGVYFSQKEHYNNHFYLMVLLCWLMAMLPANRRASLDVKLGYTKPANECYKWCLQLFVIQIGVLYIFAAIAKLYPDWLNALPPKIWFAKKHNHPYLGKLFAAEWFAYFVAYSGILFDLLIVPLLLRKRTRIAAIALMLAFHQFNKITFGIGVFPYLALCLNVFFFPGSTFDKTLGVETGNLAYPTTTNKMSRWITIAVITYIAWQVLTPFRHYLYKGDVLWTEEGHRMAWRMMLRSKKGTTIFKVKDKNSDSLWVINPKEHLLRSQASNLGTKPDFIWQYARRLKKEYKQKGYDVQVFADNKCSVNGRPMKPLIDPNVDIAAQEWKAFTHNEWVFINYK